MDKPLEWIRTTEAIRSWEKWELSIAHAKALKLACQLAAAGAVVRAIEDKPGWDACVTVVFEAPADLFARLPERHEPVDLPGAMRSRTWHHVPGGDGYWVNG